MKVNVVGAGITGIMSAYYLAKKGCEVTVYDSRPFVAMECSYANGGQISVCNSETWNNWPTVWKGVKWFFKKDAPLLVRPWPSFRKIAWLASFLKTTILNEGVRNTATTIRIALESRKLYEEIIREEGIVFDRTTGGMMHIFTNETDLKNAESVAELFKANGCEWMLLTPEQVRAREPSLRYFTGITGGVYTSGDWSGDIHKFCTYLASILKSKYGVKFELGKTIEDPRTLDAPVVLANGHQLYDMAKLIDDPINVYPVKGYSITIELEDKNSQNSAPVLPLLDNNVKIVTARMGNRLRVAGTAEFDDVNYDIRRDRIEPLLDWVHKNFPGINTHNYSQWACLRPMSSDMLPIVRKSKTYDNIYFHGGHGHLGWTMAAATGKQVAELVCAQR